MSLSKRKVVGLVGLIVLALIAIYAIQNAAQDWHHSHTPGHNSDSNIGIGASSNLRDTNNVQDSRNCVAKTRPGSFRAASQMFNNGKVVDAVYANERFEVNCHNTGINGGGHRAVIIWGGGGREYGPFKDHGN